MAENCNTKNSLQRDGTSQAQRLIAALLPDYVSVDERSIDDLIAFVKKFATEIRYYNPADAIDGDWVGFFTKSISADQRTEPHYTLFIAFLEIFKIAQDDLNTITKRHLDFYYREVLNLHERPPVADQVFIIFELAEQLSSSLVPQGKALDGKKDGLGVDLIYKTDKDIVVNQSKVEQLKAVFINRPFNLSAMPLRFPAPIPVPDPNLNVIPNSGTDWRIYASPVANSADGEGAEIETDPKRWRTFGAPHDVDGVADREQAEVGFAFASPVLFLSEGERTVTITLNFGLQPISNKLSSTLPGLLPFKISFSGEEEWITPQQITATTFLPGDQGLRITCVIGNGQKSVVAYNEEVLLQPFKTKWPVAKITIDTTSSRWAALYTALSPLIIASADVSVNVTNLRTIIIQNDDSLLANEKPFQPFGNHPVPNSTFYVGSNEVFQKKLDTLDLNITWHGLPDPVIYPNGFTSYYHRYLPAAQAAVRTNNAFKVAAYILDKKQWVLVNNPRPPRFDHRAPEFEVSYIVPEDSKYNLFAEDTNENLSNSFQKISINPNALTAIPRDPNMEPITEFGSETLRGFIRLQLDVIDFGHSIYQNSFAQQAIWATKNPAVLLSSVDALELGLPPEPYTPTIKEIYVDYSSSERVNLIPNVSADETNYNNRVDQFFHIEPFGVSENHPFVIKQSDNIALMPQFADEGSLYIGVSNMEAPQVLSILFKTAEGSENPDLEKQQVKWSYMSNNEWFDFSSIQLLGDTTNGLLKSGIVTFDIPKAITSTNTTLPAGLFWLKAAVEKESGAVCDLIDIKAQAVTATFVDNGNDPDHLRTALPAETIKDFVESDAAIDKITQPYSSFGGKLQEQSTDFYIRVSERLRHKQRAITPKDYELITLQQFPFVYKAKCLNHTRYVSNTDINELKPGHVSLVIISNLQNVNAVDPLKPKTSLVNLTEIHDYLVALNAPYAELHVKNPIFEEILVDFHVRFRPGFDNGFYEKKLNEDIKQFLAPWAYQTKDIVFGGRIHKTMILNFIEDLPYVDFVTCFSMDQIIPSVPNTPNKVLRNVDEALTTTSASVLTSAPNHRILVLENDDCGCDDNEVITPLLSIPEPCDDCTVKGEKEEDGISADEIGSTFIIGHSRGAGVDFWVIEKDFDVQ